MSVASPTDCDGKNCFLFICYCFIRSGAISGLDTIAINPNVSLRHPVLNCMGAIIYYNLTLIPITHTLKARISLFGNNISRNTVRSGIHQYHHGKYSDPEQCERHATRTATEVS